MGPHRLGRLPVVSRDDPRELLGLIGRSDIIRAYEVAVTRRAELSLRVEHMKNRKPASTEFLEVALTDGDWAVGKRIEDISKVLPLESIIVSIHRENQVIIPHGSTRLQSGDQITAFAQSQATSSFFKSLKGS